MQDNGWVPMDQAITVTTKKPVMKLIHPAALTKNTDTFYVFHKNMRPVHTAHVVLKQIREEGKAAGHLTSNQAHGIANAGTFVDASPKSTLPQHEVCRTTQFVSKANVDQYTKNLEAKMAKSTKNRGGKPIRVRNRRKFLPTDQADGMQIEVMPTLFRTEQLSTDVIVEVILRLGRATKDMVHNSAMTHHTAIYNT